MTLVRNIVIDFIQDHIRQPEGKDAGRLFDRLRSKAGNNHDADDDDDDDVVVDSDPLRGKILHSLSNLSGELGGYIDGKYNGRFTNLTEPLIPLLKNGNRQKYYDALQSLAEGLFHPDFSWQHIVTFLVYNVELTNKILELPSVGEDKTFKMVSLLINSVCRYFDESLLQWIERQDGAWMSLVAYEQASKRGKEYNTDARSVIQYIGNVAAVAAIIGGLYLCSKLTVQ